MALSGVSKVYLCVGRRRGNQRKPVTLKCLAVLNRLRSASGHAYSEIRPCPPGWDGSLDAGTAVLLTHLPLLAAVSY